MKQLILAVVCALLILPFAGITQPNFTANDQVPAYNQPHYFGTNLGYYGINWNDATLADIAAGNPSLGIDGTGVQNLRISLPEHHLEKWGYDIELSDIQHYASLGMRELTVFLQGPNDEHKMTNSFCTTSPPNLFKNMYAPIWDNGENGTPVNDDNYYALYVYKTVSQYKDYVRFWEIMSEPDYTSTRYGWQPRGEDGNWFDNAPAPCDLKNLKAPVFYYIRLLRIAYEVIKTVDPDAYIAIGGIGYTSFLDAVLRYSDKPEDGATNADFPNTGGAYFDALSYHAYPANDGSLRYYDFDLHAFVYSRHSDAAANGVIQLKNDFNEVLTQYGYGNNLPAKRWIVTESNVSRVAFNDQMGSVEGQRNFVPKIMVRSIQEGIDQFYTFILGDKKPTAAANNAWDLMGFYYSLAEAQPYQEQITPNGMAFKTAADLLHKYTYDSSLTTQLNLSDDIGGGAFRNENGDALFILWAKTTVDQSESASVLYSFPSNLNITTLEKREWDYSQNGNMQIISGNSINLGASPIYLLGAISVNTENTALDINIANIHPNPVGQSGSTLFLNVDVATTVSASIYNASGQKIKTVFNDRLFNAGEYQLAFSTQNLAAGIYFYQLWTEKGVQQLRFVVVKT